MTDTTNEVTNEGGEAEATQATAEPQNEQPTQTAESSTEQSTKSTTEQEPQDGGADQSTVSDTQVSEVKFDVPETMNLPDSAIAALTEAAQSQGVTGEQAQALLDALAPKLSEANASVVEATKQEWAQAVANDAELGGDKLNENMAIADKAVETFGDEGLRELLNDGDLPLGKEPRLFRMLVRVGRAISEATMVNGGITAGSSKPIQGDVFTDTSRAASIMYPSNNN